MIKKLTKGIEETTKEKEKQEDQKEKLRKAFKTIEEKAFTVQEKYKEAQKVSGAVHISYYLDMILDKSLTSIFFSCT